MGQSGRLKVGQVPQECTRSAEGLFVFGTYAQAVQAGQVETPG